MNIEYIYHSGFLVELAHCVLIFDYYKGSLPEFDNQKPVFVFASHKHHDHYDPVIYTLRQKALDVTYILSDDIRVSKHEDKQLDVVFIGPHEKKDIRMIQVETLLSTDEGVAFVVEADGKSIYHAGDLNWWHWNGEGEEYNAAMGESYRREIDSLKGRHFDAAFVPVDPRLEDKFYLGIDYFMRTADADMVYPMHCWDSPVIVKKLIEMKESEPYRTKIYEAAHTALPHKAE